MFIKDVKELFPKNEKWIPAISGAAAVLLLLKVLFSNLQGWYFYTGVIATLVMFLSSLTLFYFLSKFEKEKDQYLLSTVGKIVEDVFKHYGVAMASNAAGPTTATQMNPIMQTIVNLIKELQTLAEKGYK